SDLQDKNLQLTDKKLSVQKAVNKLLEVQQEYRNIESTYKNDINRKKDQKIRDIQKSKLEVTRKQQALTSKENELKEAKIKLSENQQLFTKGFISETDLKEQEKKVKQVEIDLTNAQDEIFLSNLDLEQKELELQSFSQDVRNNKSEPQQKLKEARNKIDQAV
ncbi:MAG: hypothetical protein ACKPGB_13295, partial [Dolichospermum sp.]